MKVLLLPFITVWWWWWWCCANCLLLWCCRCLLLSLAAVVCCRRLMLSFAAVACCCRLLLLLAAVACCCFLKLLLIPAVTCCCRLLLSLDADACCCHSMLSLAADACCCRLKLLLLLAVLLLSRLLLSLAAFAWCCCLLLFLAGCLSYLAAWCWCPPVVIMMTSAATTTPTQSTKRTCRFYAKTRWKMVSDVPSNIKMTMLIASTKTIVFLPCFAVHQLEVQARHGFLSTHKHTQLSFFRERKWDIKPNMHLSRIFWFDCFFSTACAFSCGAMSADSMAVEDVGSLVSSLREDS